MGVMEADRMAKKKKRDDEPAKFDREVLRMARIVCAIRNIPLAEYLSERLRPLVIQDLRDHERDGLVTKSSGDAPSARKPRP